MRYALALYIVFGNPAYYAFNLSFCCRHSRVNLILFSATNGAAEKRMSYCSRLFSPHSSAFSCLLFEQGEGTKIKMQTGEVNYSHRNILPLGGALVLFHLIPQFAASASQTDTVQYINITLD